ncbi:VanZ family protein [Microterricola viridarii]|uniref:VanZ-like domain-containing protein n=1 Tax=Microterricola viridarii TaxID=412690 RepID=A0A0X8E5I1_9MICO|nr:VanZ family protein [Microterricola viridarii]AMB59396.1 hypothetical protein AWU67_11595 [Microterricola viridarii]
MFAAYLVALALIVFTPGSDAERVTGILASVAHAVEAWGVPFELGYGVLEFGANIVLFVPFGLLLGMNAPLWHPWLVVATGLATSCLIEFVQLGLPSRFSTASDLLANTLGTVLGVALLALWRQAAARRP